MSRTNRREFLSLAGGAAAIATMGAKAELAGASIVAGHESFDFLFVTDTHLQPGLNAPKGVAMALHKARTIPADFAIQGGDHVYDVNDVTREQAKSLFDLYLKTEQDLGLKLHHLCGNHDCFGISPGGKISKADPEYGKKMFEEHFGPAYYSFDHKGVHFLVLDSVQPGMQSYDFVAHVDEAQLKWIAADLDKQPRGTPIIASIHVPLVTAEPDYEKQRPGSRPTRGGTSVDNSEEVIAIFDKHNVIGVMQGHSHIYETVIWHDVPYVTSGAVCGNWWKGKHLGTPEGFSVVSVANGKMNVRYETYGFEPVERHDD